jgi:hypothetical protein
MKCFKIRSHLTNRDWPRPLFNRKLIESARKLIKMAASSPK